MKKDIFVGIVTASFFGSFAWMATTLISVDKRTEITAVKVNANYEMIKPLWEDFIIVVDTVIQSLYYSFLISSRSFNAS